MSLHELHVKGLEEQVCDLTRDCYYLLSLLNQSDEIDWDNWPQGQKIKEHLKRSEDFFQHQEYQRARFAELRKNRVLNTPDNLLDARDLRYKNALQAVDELRKREEAKKLEAEMRRLTEENQKFQAEADARAKWAKENYRPEYEPPNPRNSRRWYELERDRINHYSIDQALSDILIPFDTFRF